MRLKYLLGVTSPEVKDYDTEIDIRYVSSLREGVKDSLMFINRTNVDCFQWAEKVQNCIIIVEQDLGGEKFIKLESTGTYLIYSKNAKLEFSKLVERYNLRTVYGLEPPTDYLDIKATSKVLSKSAKIYNAIIGEGCSFHHNVLVGVDDFAAISTDNDELAMFPQLGNVILGKGVEIYSNSIIGRGALGSTIIGDYTKIDALCQIGHNCIIGNRCIIAAGSIVAGSCIIGNDVVIGVHSSIRNGVKIGNNVTVGMGSVVINDVPDNAVVVGNPAKVIKTLEPRDPSKVFDR